MQFAVGEIRDPLAVRRPEGIGRVVASRQGFGVQGIQLANPQKGLRTGLGRHKS